ncbi:MAG: ribulose-phosphate 3-epimerase [bacterium]|nr:ribulose-phosphate 3-epimerase [bacterium]
MRVAPSLLAADFGRLAEQVATVEDAGAEVLHLDVMDGHFVPNISFGIPVIQSLRSRSRLFFDAHLMIKEPQRYAEAFVNAGSDLLTFHIEVTDTPGQVIDHIRSLGVPVGVSINPTTPVSAIEPILPDVDLVLVMSVWPGFGGQSFMAEVLEKVVDLRGRLRPDQRLEIDGGIDPGTIEAAVTAGADTLVAGSAVFGSPDPVAAMHKLADLAESAWTRRKEVPQ